MQLPGAKTPISPKVLSGANWSGYATLIMTVLGFITPDMLTQLGNFAPLVYGLITAATYAIGAYLKTDPARDAGLAVLAPAAVPVVTPSAPAAGTIIVNSPAPAPSEDPAAPPVDPAPADTPAAPAATN